MNAVTKAGEDQIIIDGLHPAVSAQVVESWHQTVMHVAVQPVPSQLASFFFRDRQEAVVCMVPLSEDPSARVKVSYESALLDTDGKLVKIVMKGMLPPSLRVPEKDRLHSLSKSLDASIGARC